MLTQDRDDELVLFLEMRRLAKGHQASLSMGSDHCKSSTTLMSSQRYPLRRTAADNFLYSDNEKSDYDWLVTPPGSPSKSLMNQLDAPDANPMALKSRLENCREEERNNTSSKNQPIGLKRPSSSNSSRSTSRPSTPATRSITPTSRVTSTAARSTSSSRSTSRPSTPTIRPSSSGTSRATSTAARAKLPSFSTGSARSTSRPSTPTRRPSSSGTSRASLTTARATTVNAQQTTGTAASTRSSTRPMSAPNTKPGSRPSTPTCRPPTPTGSSSVFRSKPTKPVCKPAPSPTLRSRPWEPYEMPGFSLEAPSNLRTTLPDRPQTASSLRTIAFGASSVRSASKERAVARTRRQSCSPSRNRAPIGNANGAVPLLCGRRAKTSNDDGGLISPVAKGNQMVERVVNVRKLSPPRPTENGGRGGGKLSSESDGFGFGRNLLKSSFDMALRHKDIKRGSMTGNFRPLATKVPEASLYSVRSSGTRRKRPVSSSGSSESSVNILCLDGSDENLSDISY